MNLSKLIALRYFATNKAQTAHTFKISLASKIDLVFGWHGNCTATHFFQFEWFGIRRRRGTARPAWATFRYRSPAGRETTVYLRDQLFLLDFNSEQIATRFGQFHETNFGGYHQYKGWLGRHTCM